MVLDPPSGQERVRGVVGLIPVRPPLDRAVTAADRVQRPFHLRHGTEGGCRDVGGGAAEPPERVRPVAGVFSHAGGDLRVSGLDQQGPDPADEHRRVPYDRPGHRIRTEQPRVSRVSERAGKGMGPVGEKSAGGAHDLAVRELRRLGQEARKWGEEPDTGSDRPAQSPATTLRETPPPRRSIITSGAIGRYPREDGEKFTPSFSVTSPGYHSGTTSGILVTLPWTEPWPATRLTGECRPTAPSREAHRSSLGEVEDRIWPRPVPLVGDTTSAAARSANPAGWAFDPATVDGVHAVLAARRDVRRFRPDAIPEAVLRRVLQAGHQAPSVGHSQPWRFIVVTQPATRDRAALLSDRERLRQADQLTADRRSRLLDLQLDGIREAPVGIVVVCDRRAPAAGVLGRATFVDADMWSCACAVQNMWIAARAAGLGMGWVTLFRPQDLAGLLGLPDGVETLGWLCLGWPDERPPAPGLERHGWSQRLPLDEVVISERWPTASEPVLPVSHLAGPDQHAVVTGRDSGDDLLTVPGSLGVLDSTVNRVRALRPEPPTGGTLVLIAGDHPVTRYAVSAYDPSVTEMVLEATRSGVSVGAATARRAGLRVVAKRAEPSQPAGDLAQSDALGAADVEALILEGTGIGERLAADGLICLGEVGVGNTTVAAALACLLLDISPETAVGLGSSSDSPMLQRKLEVVTKAVSRARSDRSTGARLPHEALSAVGGPEIALLAGVAIGGSRQRVPVVLDGMVTSIAALVAVLLEPAVQSALVAGQRSREQAHQHVLTELGLEPLLDLRLRSGEGVGACLAAQMLLTALGVRDGAARVYER